MSRLSLSADLHDIDYCCSRSLVHTLLFAVLYAAMCAVVKHMSLPNRFATVDASKHADSFASSSMPAVPPYGYPPPYPYPYSYPYHYAYPYPPPMPPTAAYPPPAPYSAPPPAAYPPFYPPPHGWPMPPYGAPPSPAAERSHKSAKRS